MRDDFLDERQRTALRALRPAADRGYYLAGGAEAVRVAGLRDIAAMKIEAIASRGARKDFYDLYFICQSGLSLQQAIAAFEKRFASAQPDLYHRLRALTFFDDAEREPEPNLVRLADWSAVRTFFVAEVKAIWEAP